MRGFHEIWDITRASVDAFIEDDALTRGAAIAFFATSAFAPVLYIATAIAGLVFGREKATGAITHEIGALIGASGQKLLWAALHNSVGWGDKLWPNVISVALLIVTASGMFNEMQSALNIIWKVESKGLNIWLLFRARIASLGLVLALGFLLLISLVTTTAIHALGDSIRNYLPFTGAIAGTINFAVSSVLIALLFAAIYKVLPDRALQWRDVITGAIGTTLLLEAGEYLIGLYLGNFAVGARYGAAGGLIVLLTWLYYTAQVFLLGAEFTKVYSLSRRSTAPPPKDIARPIAPDGQPLEQAERSRITDL
ncbi:MAG TPA: YihY/virulence factor BrkB family protein [Rhizomicrobium sp.]